MGTASALSGSVNPLAMGAASMGVGGVLLAATSARQMVSSSRLLVASTYAGYSWTSHRLMRRGVPSRASGGATFAVAAVVLLPALVSVGRPFLDSWTDLVSCLVALALPVRRSPAG